MKKLSLLPLLVLVSISLTHAQKLPKAQTSSVSAPADIKIDGKLTEWNDQFHAHNQPNHIYYTLSNDDKNLYLTAQMDDALGSKKIFKGGLTFTIIPFDKKSNKIAVTFPVIYRNKRVKMEDVEDSQVIDSLRSSSKGEITNTYKEIHIKGIPEISDPFQSIYNTKGILVGASFNKQKRYTYELAIPLKYLEGAINNTKSIRYNIKLNVQPIDAKSSVQNGPRFEIVDPNPNSGHFSIDDLFNYEDSDFSGVYTLAVKP